VSHRDSREPVGWTVSHAWAKQKEEMEGADNDFVPGPKRERWRGGGYNVRRSEGVQRSARRAVGEGGLAVDTSGGWVAR
jgi:hypothetical protein